MRRITIALLLVAHAAFAQEPGKIPLDEAPPPPTQAVPDPAFAAMRGRAVAIDLTDGRTLSGELAGFDPATATVILAGSGEVATVPRAAIVRLRAQSAITAPPPAAPPLPAAAEPLETNRHIGLQLGFGPAIAAVDVDYRPFYGFLSTTLAMPIFTDGKWGAVALGLGGTFRVSRTSAWQFDVFVHGAVAWDDTRPTCSGAPTYTCSSSSNAYGTIGLGVGFHYTFQRGFTVGFKLPVIGVAFGGPQIREAGDLGAYYYLSAALSLPVVSFGYRF